MPRFYDPPSGWRYGFPKEYKPLPDEKLVDTLRRDGYPEGEIQQWGEDGPPCRFWGSEQMTKTLELDSEELQMELDKANEVINRGDLPPDNIFLMGYNLGRRTRGLPPVTKEEMFQELGVKPPCFSTKRGIKHGIQDR